jgi:ATP-dependent DNA helicase RecQ
VQALPGSADQAAADDPLERAARDGLGVAYLFPYQRLVVSNILEGRSQIVLLPTGAGKSLCFMLPAVILAGLTLVIVPLLSLMEDLRRRMAEAGLPSGVLRGDQSPQQREAELDSSRRGQTRVLLTTPETALRRSSVLATCRVEHLVVDEAHCIALWGNSFRPAYLQLGGLIQRLAPRIVSAFTATASGPVVDQVRTSLFTGRGVNVVVANPDRPST